MKQVTLKEYMHHVLTVRRNNDAMLTPATAQRMLHSGAMPQERYESFMHVWATQSHHYGSDAAQWKLDVQLPDGWELPTV